MIWVDRAESSPHSLRTSFIFAIVGIPTLEAYSNPKETSPMAHDESLM